MTKFAYKHPKFLKSAVHPKDWPALKDSRGNLFPEVALFGKSNVGKSSLLNHLLNTSGLAKTSATPGKTQLLNFFLVDGKVCFVDMPGYGYAKVPLKIKETWGKTVQNYLEKRENLHLVLLLLDIRRDPDDMEISFTKWAQEAGLLMALILTKTDKLNQSDAVKQKRKILDVLAFDHCICYSVKKNRGKKELQHLILDSLLHVTRNES